MIFGLKICMPTGVNVMITIFCDFYPFSAKKLAFFSKTNVMITIFSKLALFCVKNANIFDKFFGKNILKIIVKQLDSFLTSDRLETYVSNECILKVGACLNTNDYIRINAAQHGEIIPTK
jgi:hypothetical protein